MCGLKIEQICFCSEMHANDAAADDRSANTFFITICLMDTNYIDIFFFAAFLLLFLPLVVFPR